MNINKAREIIDELVLHGTSIINVTHQCTWFEVHEALKIILNYNEAQRQQIHHLETQLFLARKELSELKSLDVKMTFKKKLCPYKTLCVDCGYFDAKTEECKLGCKQ